MKEKDFEYWKDGKTKKGLKRSEYFELDKLSSLDTETRDAIIMELAEMAGLVVLQRHTFYGHEEITTQILTQEQWDQIPEGYDCQHCNDGEKSPCPFTKQLKQPCIWEKNK